MDTARKPATATTATSAAPSWPAAYASVDSTAAALQLAQRHATVAMQLVDAAASGDLPGCYPDDFPPHPDHAHLVDTLHALDMVLPQLAYAVHRANAYQRTLAK